MNTKSSVLSLVVGVAGLSFLGCGPMDARESTPSASALGGASPDESVADDSTAADTAADAKVAAASEPYSPPTPDDESTACRELPEPAVVSGLTRTGVTWALVGAPSDAVRVAACADGRLYALNKDRSIWVNDRRGCDAAWRFVADSGAEDIGCANGRLYVKNVDRAIFRNDGDDTMVRWAYVGRPTNAAQVAFGTGPSGVSNSTAGLPILFARNDDGTLYRNTLGGADGYWQLVGQDAPVLRIANAGTTIFAVGAGGSLLRNTGWGADGHWQAITEAGGIADLAVVNAERFYALTTDRQLWAARVQGGARRDITVSPPLWRGIMAVLGFAGPVGSDSAQISIDAYVATFTPSSFLAAAGVNTVTVGIPTKFFDLNLPMLGRVATLYAQMASDIRARTMSAELGDDRISLTMAFEEDGPEINTWTSLSWLDSPGVDIVDFRLTGDLMVRHSVAGDSVVVPENVRFHGGLSVRGNLGVAWNLFVGGVQDQIGTAIRQPLERIFSQSAAQAAIRDALVDYARRTTLDAEWQGVVYDSLRISGGILRFTVEK